ncbi:MAG: FAD-dependent oxidoreductase [Bdellovibrionales bacterium]
MADIGVVGLGIIGLTTAIALQRAGHTVHIYSRESMEETTSWAAGAISYPFAIEETRRVVDWFLQTNATLETMMDDPAAGIDVVTWRKYSVHGLCEHPFWLDDVGGKVLKGADCPDPYQSGVEAELPMVAVQHYYPFMFDIFQNNGGELTICELGALEDVPHAHDIVINASGVGAKDLCGDDKIYPGRGQVLVVKNPGIAQHTTLFDRKFYIYPRREQVILGGSYDEHEWDRTPDEDLTQEILEWVAMMEPALKVPEILDVLVGLRPVRARVRLEKDVLNDGRAVVHNYGHGGCGYTVSWGCAQEVLNLVESL